MSKRNRHRTADDQPAITENPCNESPVLDLPIVAEAATDVAASENAAPVEPITYDTGAVWCLPPPVELPAELPVVEPVIDWHSSRISAGKLLAKHLRIPPASAQQRAADLSESQVTRILACQLDADPSIELRAIVG